MTFYSIIVSIIIEEKNEIYILINTGCLIYKIISFRFIKKTGFEYIDILIRKLIGIEEKKSCINEIMKVDMDIDRYW